METRTVRDLHKRTHTLGTRRISHGKLQTCLITRINTRALHHTHWLAFAAFFFFFFSLGCQPNSWQPTPTSQKAKKVYIFSSSPRAAAFLDWLRRALVCHRTHSYAGVLMQKLTVGAWEAQSGKKDWQNLTAGWSVVFFGVSHIYSLDHVVLKAKICWYIHAACQEGINWLKNKERAWKQRAYKMQRLEFILSNEKSVQYMIDLWRVHNAVLWWVLLFSVLGSPLHSVCGWRLQQTLDICPAARSGPQHPLASSIHLSAGRARNFLATFVEKFCRLQGKL